ncbi:MAG TPA: hypothetical protein VK119_00110 [Bacillota bacterium]|nr:hypothetical protein [Bacillota bacterium]
MKKKDQQNQNPFSCQTCSIQIFSDQTGKKSKKSWVPNICIGHVGLLITAVFILMMQITQ